MPESQEQVELEAKDNQKTQLQVSINQLSAQGKLGEALKRALPLFPNEVRERIQELANPESISAIATIGAVYVASHAVGIGELGDAAVLGVGAVTLGSEAVNVTKDLSDFVQNATQAKNEGDLDRAAEHLASAVSKVSVDAVAAVLAHKSGRATSELSSVDSPVRQINQPLMEDTPVLQTGGKIGFGQRMSDEDRELKYAPEAYELIRNTTDDVIRITQNTEWPEYRIQRIKEHLFYHEHQLRDGRIDRFDPLADIAESWERLSQDRFIRQDIDLLKHEYFESRFEGIFKTDYDTAHTATINPRSGRTWDPHEPQYVLGNTDKLPPILSTLPIVGAAVAQQTQSAEAKETPQPQRVETSVSAAIISNGQVDALEQDKADKQLQPDPALAAAQTYEKLISTQGQYDSYYNVTRFKEDDYTARLDNDTKVLSVESTDNRGILLTYNQDTQKLSAVQPLNETDIQHFKELQTKLDTSKKETPKVEPPVRPQPVQLSGKAAPSSISQEQLDRVEDVARDYAYHHPDSQKAGENFTYESKDYQFAQKDQTLTITAKDGRDVILQMNTYTRDIAVNKITPEDSRQITQMSSTTALASERDAQARMVTDSALAVLDRYGKETKGGRFYSEGDYQISQQGDREGAIQIIDARNGNELLYAKAEGVMRENLGEDDIQNFSTLKVQMEQQRAGPSPQQPQQEIGDLEMGSMA
jgi:hypothetical protein